MSRDPTITHLLEQIDLVALIREHHPLEESGNSWRGWHSVHPSQSKQSLVVWIDNGIPKWFCFNCQRGGTAIDYLMERDNLSCRDAIVYLCEMTGDQMHDWDPQQHAQWEERRLVEEILGHAADYYHQQLTPKKRVYLHQRSLTDATIDKFRLGYADGRLYDALKGGQYSQKQLLRSGLFKVFENGAIKDCFQERYVFPYLHCGKVVYMIARRDPSLAMEALPPWNHAKYLKLPLYNESKYPYISQTLANDAFYGEDSIHIQNEVIITEGVMDCLLALQVGFACISPAATRFRQADWERLSNLVQRCKTVYIVNDSEKSGAGEKGAIKTAEHLFEKGNNVRLATLPRAEGVDKVDLADFLSRPSDDPSQPVDELCQLMEQAPDVIEWRIRHLQEQLQREHPEGIRQVTQLIAGQPELERERYIDLVVRAGLANRSVMKRAIKRAQRDLMAEQARSPEEALRWQIKEVRLSELKSWQIHRGMSDIIISHMKECGAFYQTDFAGHYWFDSQDKKLYGVESNALGSEMNDRYDINESEAVYQFLVKELRTESIVNGTKTEVHRFAHYDKEQKILYVSNNANQMYRLDGDSIELVDNGTDGVLFLENQAYQPFGYEPGNCGLIASLIVEPIPFVSGPDVNLNREEQQQLFLIWLYSLFFESLQPTKPIQCFLGPKGSGKSTCQRIIGRWLFGQHFNVTPITKQDAFIATICKHALVAFDNVDGKIPWLPDSLAQAATGQRIALRELYETNTEASFFPRCFISLNAREPKFARDDVVDRLLVFRVERLAQWRPESEILDEVAANRNALWSELLDGLNDIVRCLRQERESFSSPFRMADWAKLGWQISRRNSDGNGFVGLLRKMDQTQSEFLFEHDSLMECLNLWLEQESNQGREVNSKTLFDELQKLAERESLDWPYKSVRSFGMHLRNTLSNLREYFEVEEKKERNRWTYAFRSKLTPEQS